MNREIREIRETRYLTAEDAESAKESINYQWNPGRKPGSGLSLITYHLSLFDREIRERREKGYLAKAPRPQRKSSIINARATGNCWVAAEMHRYL